MPGPSPRLRSATPPSVEAFLQQLRADPKVSPRIAGVRLEPARPAEEEPLPDSLPLALRRALEADGKHQLYRHQRQAIDHALAGRNVVIATETSSGKTLCFQIPVLGTLMVEPSARALFIFPTNPLANDQSASLGRLLAQLPEEVRPRAPVRLHGGMGAQKDQLALTDPPIVLTNPEMVHLHLLPQHKRWQRLWAGLRYIVIDEIHLYRGAFGGHLANLLRRVRRCAWRYGAKPQIIAASATVGNPRALAEELCAAPFELVEKSTAPRGLRSTVLWQSVGEDRKSRPYVDESVDLFRRALAAGLQSILFARSRQLVELMVSKLEEKTGRSRIALGVRAYRAGYLRDEREVIEDGLRKGTVRGVVTTNALEVGIDIGSLDVCVMAGYPGTLMAMRQQSGRVGRRDRPSAIFFVASSNPLDTYLMRHPELLFNAPSERAVVGRLNPHVLRAHVACAASEFPLWEAEIERLGGDVARAAARELVERGEARWGVEGARTVLLANGRPHGSVSLRSASQERFALVDPDGETVGEIDGASVAREAHPGAVYLHQGRAFRVDSVENGRVCLRRGQPGTSTRVQGERSVSLHAERRRSPFVEACADAVLGVVDVVDSYSSYLESTGAGRPPRPRPIEPPMRTQLRTEGLAIRLSDATRERLGALDGFSLASALHGAEHLLTAFASSLVMCDRDDLEGHVLSADDGSGVVLFDRHPGGLGFASGAFDLVSEIVARAGEAVDACVCSDGCPACVHSGRCLRSNDEVSKAGARAVLRILRGMPLDYAKMAQRPVAREPLRRPRAVDFEAKTGEPASSSDKPWSPAFAVGDRVEHAVYGEGKVVEIRPTGRVVVDFADGAKPRRIAPGWLRKV